MLELKHHVIPYSGYMDGYKLISAKPAVGVIYEINDFISGHVRLRGRENGAYPYKYLEMIDSIFGKAEKTIEVCSGNIEGDPNLTRVDLNPLCAPDVIDDAEKLSKIEDDVYTRWRADPPYNEEAAFKMYDVRMPSLFKLLEAGARVVIAGALLFLLCQQNYQICPSNVKRIGMIFMSIVPNNETRVLNIYQKRESND